MRIDRYELFGPFATGGMASIHFGKLFASAGFQRVVAIKVAHVQFVRDPDFRAMFLDEARIVARIRSPHVVATLDIIEQDENLYQVMEYANGPALSGVLKVMRARGEQIPIPILLSIMIDTLDGLHAAHEVKDDQGAPLDVVHRDVSPQNILVTEDGHSKVIDFGIASAAGKMHLTQPGDVKGKVSYMAPEQVQAKPTDRRADVYAVGVVLYEALTNKRPFTGDDFAQTALMHINDPVPDPRVLRPEISEELGTVIARALEKNQRDRFPNARSMADALLALPTPRAAPRDVAAWLADASRDFFEERRALIAALPSIEPEGEDAIIVNADAFRLSQVPTQIEGISLEENRPASDRKKTALATWRVPLLATALVATIGFAFALSPKMLPVAASSPSATAPMISPASSASSSSSAPTAIASASSAPVEAKVADVAAPASSHLAKPHVPRHDAQSGAATTASAPDPIARPPCCAGDLRIRFADCANNCLGGT